MRVNIYPGKAVGTSEAPPSKSALHRLLIAAALCRHQTTLLHGFYPSADVLATVDCLRALGADISILNGCCTVQGTAPQFAGGAVLPCRESGSTLRFLLPVCMCSDATYTLCGSERLLSRPLDVYEMLASQQGLSLCRSPQRNAVTVSGRLRTDGVCIPGNISSQFVSGLLFRAAAAAERATLQITAPFESRSYVAMTGQALGAFGVHVTCTDSTVTIDGSLCSPGTVCAEGDWSGAAFFEALNSMGGSVSLQGLRADSLQPDRCFLQIVQSPSLCADLCDCPDLAPMLFALAAFRGAGHFTGTRRLRFKESDRIAAMQQELAKFGAILMADADTVTIRCASLHSPTQVLCSHNDHRIVMALAILCTATGGVIEGAEAVAKSMPDFFEKLRALGVKVDETDS